MTEEEVEAIAAAVRAGMHAEEVEEKKRRHWPRRVVLCFVVFGAAAITHKLIEHHGLAHFMQSAELGFAALFDSIFTKVRE